MYGSDDSHFVEPNCVYIPTYNGTTGYNTNMRSTTSILCLVYTRYKNTTTNYYPTALHPRFPYRDL